jgi:hypothetical protein
MKAMADWWGEKFVAKRGLGTDGEFLRGRIVGRSAQSMKATAHVSESLMAVDTVVEVAPEGAQIAVKGVDFLSGKERQLLARMQFDASEVAGIRNADDLPAYIKKELVDNKGSEAAMWAKQQGIPRTEKTAQRLGQAAKNQRKYLDGLKKMDELNGLEYDAQAAYFPFKQKNAKAFQEHPTTKLFSSGRDHTKLSHTMRSQVHGQSFSTLEQLKVGAKKGEILAHPSMDLNYVLQQRVGASFGYAAQADSLQEMVEVMGKHAGLSGGRAGRAFDEDMIGLASDLRKSHPQLAKEMADAAEGRARGLLTGDKSASQLANDLNRGVAKNASGEELAKAIENFEPSAFMTDGSIESIMSQYRSIMDDAARNQKQRVFDDLEALKPVLEEKLQAAHYSNAIAQAATDATGTTLKDLNKVSKGVERLERNAGKKGLGKYLTALLEREGAETAADLTPDGLKRLNKLFEKPKASRAIEEFLTPAESLVRLDGPAFAKFKVRDPGSQKLVPLSNFAVDADVVREYARVVDPELAMKDSGGALFTMMDFVTNPLKKFLTGTTIAGLPRPAFFGRNVMDLTFRRGGALTSYAGIPQKEYLKASLDIVRGTNLEKTLTLNGQKFTLGEIQDFLKESGLWHHDWGRVGGNWAPVEAALKYLDEGKAINYRAWKEDFYSKVGGVLRPLSPEVIGSGMENFAIVEAFLGQLGQKQGVTKALQNMRRHLFDYSNLTPFEKRLSRFLLFYNFQRQALPWVLDGLSRRPFVYGKLANLGQFDTMTEDERARIPKWIRKFPWAEVSRKGNTVTIASMRNIFTVDVLMDAPANLNEVVQKLNPLLLAPIELAMGREVFLKRDILPVKTLRKEYRGLKDVGPGGIPIPLSGLNWLKAREVTGADGQKFTAVDGERWYLMRKLWASRVFRDLDDVGKAFAGDQPLLNSFMNLGLGIKLQDYDLDKQNEFLRKDAGKLKSAYDRARRSGDRQRALELLYEARGRP